MDGEIWELKAEQNWQATANESVPVLGGHNGPTRRWFEWWTDEMKRRVSSLDMVRLGALNYSYSTK